MVIVIYVSVLLLPDRYKLYFDWSVVLFMLLWLLHSQFLLVHLNVV